MSLAPVIARAWRDNVLVSALVELTYACNLDCFYCYNDLGLPGEPLSRAQWERLFEDLAALQVLQLTLTGGEPLAHPDFFALGRRARELGFLIRIKSNGHAVDEARARRLRDEVDPFMVEVSLHGARPETHDRQTRVAGSFERLVGNLGAMARVGLRVKLNATLTAWNEGEVEPMFALADRLGLPLGFGATVTPRDDGDATPLTVAPSRAAVARLYRVLGDRSPDPPAGEGCTPPPSSEKNCGAGSSGIAVDPHGNVYPCVQWRRPLGNLHQASIREIWESSPVLPAVRGLTVEAKRRREGLGETGRWMSFCLGLSEQHTGDPLGVEPGALTRAELLRQVRTGAGGAGSEPATDAAADSTAATTEFRRPAAASAGRSAATTAARRAATAAAAAGERRRVLLPVIA